MRQSVPGMHLGGLWLALLASLCLPWLGGCSRGAQADDEQAGAAAAASVLVTTQPLQQGSLARTVLAYGVVQADPGAQNSIVAPVAAEVGQVYVRPGQAVSAGQALLQLRPTPPTQSVYAQALSTLKVATESTRRTRQLLQQYLATEQQLADAEKAESDARAALDALREQGAAGPRVLRAPFDAIVTDVTTTVRSLVTEGNALLTLTRPGGLVLIAGVAPELAAGVTAGNDVSISPVGESSTHYAGRVLQRGALVQSDSGLVPVQISLPARKFLPGESAQASITVGMVSGYVVPHEAVLIDDNGNNYVVQAVNDTAKLVTVQVLDTQGDREVISGPLIARAPLVVSGNYQAQDGMKLRYPTTAPTPGAVPDGGHDPAHGDKQ